MEQAPFIFTICFMLLGPIKVLPAFARATRGSDAATKRKTALYAFLFASAICAFLVLAGQTLIDRYQLSLASLSIAGGLVLLIAALRTMFFGSAAPNDDPESAQRSPVQVAMSPLASPAIVPPAGVAVVLIASMHATQTPGLGAVVIAAVATMMVLDLLAMLFNDTLVKLPGLMLVLQLLGSALIFVQVALGIDSILTGLSRAGIIAG